MELEPQTWRNNVAALIVDEKGNLLLGGNPGDNSHWHVPQGGVRSKESLFEAVLREVKEEVGLQAEQLHYLASVGGFRYRYRAKNRKSAYWAGQQQSYFLFRCREVRPQTRTEGSREFSDVIWLPWRKVRPELFVSFKREVMERVLQLFFPACEDNQQWEEQVLRHLTTKRYLVSSAASWEDPRDTMLFAGEKEGVGVQMADLEERLSVAQRQKRLLVLILGPEGSGKVNCLRNVARCLDPLYTRAIPPGEPLPFEESLNSLKCEYVKMQASSPYDSLVEEWLKKRPVWEQHVSILHRWEQQMQKAGIPVVKIFLNTSWKAANKRHPGLETLGRESWEQKQEAYRQIMAATGTWYAVPSDHRWYRNYVVTRLVTEALEGAYC